jgi:hypothetical protein
MKQCRKPLALATALLALPLFALAQDSGTQNGQNPTGMDSSQNTGVQHTGKREAQRMVAANAELLDTLDAKDMHAGSTFKAKLSKEATLNDGTKLPIGTVLMGRIAADDMQMQGTSKLAVRFAQAQLKDGKIIPVKATIVGIAPPATADGQDNPEMAGNQVPNSWTDGTLQVDQLDVVNGVDLHSSIKSKNSGVFVSKTKDNVKLDRGTEIQLAIAQRMDQRNAMASGGNN